MNEQITHMAGQVTAGKMTRREFMGKAAALGVSAAMASTMFADAARAAGPVKGGTFKMGVQGGESTNTQDPALWSSDVPIAGGQQWGETLVEVNGKGELEGLVAESWEGSADAKTWRFKVRQGIEFSNGKTVTPEDIMRTMERHTNEDSQSGALGIVQGIESMRVDGDTFEVTMEIGNADLPYLLADYHLKIQPDGGFDDPNSAVGTGPYVLESDEPGVRMQFVRNPNYWGGDAFAHYDSVEVITLNDATARTAALQSGQVDIINRVEPKIAQLLDRAPNLSVQNVSGRGHYVFIMHVDTAPFDANELRLALKYAINREEMVDKILRGYGGIGNDMPINAAYPLFDDSIPQREYDPAKAAEHYKKSGHDGSPIILRTADGAFPGAVDAAALFQQTAQAAGIPLEVKREPNDGYWSEVWNVQPFCASYWSGRPVQDQMYATAYLSTADWNDTRFKRPEFDEMLLAARSELDDAKRKEIYSKMGMMVRDEGGLILPMFNDFIDAVSNEVQGYVPDPNGAMMYWYASKFTWKA
ncbi:MULTISPECIES: ABC transporter substrate-binding protein [unclassified Ruegeria]|uniref:ABC transporter substrate-binding protein n=1 Tax=unclassified Ruegeria TaxID=2625375 RepID=UPI00148812C1|nr:MULTISPECIES: ABC transporter substrate-binding protein [unclassified Ruegeria]NOD34598.1 twin-arginine translocation signal domain-containing protein [Ruegeria sp. HKCCD7296]NOD48214.1 twin-arginine translocation signal domain-containing protein [Ruegeria sp. HKCCD5849]NOD52234.1 twin-arginine translocation signal domain-containing protein [Ruegeria sp. HKCCD5851]NOD68337.1 twin-arginine translocation signal domain-containing protein [Ruegeria sp. HKCCD7303]NOE34856.1 twin-arginine translo